MKLDNSQKVAGIIFIGILALGVWLHVEKMQQEIRKKRAIDAIKKQ